MLGTSSSSCLPMAGACSTRTGSPGSRAGHGAVLPLGSGDVPATDEQQGAVVVEPGPEQRGRLRAGRGRSPRSRPGRRWRGCQAKVAARHRAPPASRRWRAKSRRRRRPKPRNCGWSRGRRAVRDDRIGIHLQIVRWKKMVGRSGEVPAKYCHVCRATSRNCAASAGVGASTSRASAGWLARQPHASSGAANQSVMKGAATTSAAGLPSRG